MSMTLFEALRADHALQRGLIRELATTRADSPRRALLWEQLKDELCAHARAEERHLYVPLTAHESAAAQARHNIAEHHELDQLVADLDSTNMGSETWLERARYLFARVERHLQHEEDEIFALAARVLGDRDRFRYAEGYIEAMREERHAA